MHSLTYPIEKAGCPVAILRDTLGDKLSQAEMRKLGRLYLLYVKKRGLACRLKASTAFAGAQGDWLRSAYKATYKDKPLEWLRTALLAVAGNRCPSCGGTRPVELDHHLPKSEYAEYSVFPINLAAICGPCNKSKLAKVGATVETSFLHPYLDRIPEVAFLDAATHRSNGSYLLRFAFTGGAVTDPLLALRMKNQFGQIDMDASLAAEITELLSELACRFEDELEDPAGTPASPELVRAYLERSAKRVERQHRVGFWQAIMLRALANDASFCGGGYRSHLPR
ncbi:hypothetical protein SAMN05428974_0526 [Sphingopyxis sp. YR583]|uniref:HNH endonuclease n=1 Tax=Sphingopyxis sp. YR583 TaxID=1881047 RepID=UPI0008A7271A|nr:HNH endonuclease signature motif containing protein [Sphingopyxis sp. YR583]SEH12643.1 hypothetical protein SAMN05428974_0526 [Sphingopyxis sp. YR583]